MGNLLPTFKKMLYDSFKTMLSSNTDVLYGFASRNVPFYNDIPNTTGTVTDTCITPVNQMILGAEIVANNVVPVIQNLPYESGLVYQQWDNLTPNFSNTNYYTVTSPSVPGGNYDVYKCISNANGSPSIYQPDQTVMNIFTKADGYSWKYMYSISLSDYTKFASTDYVPVTPNSSVVADALTISGIDRIDVNFTGDGYITVNSGVIRTVAGPTLLQIDYSAQPINDFYTYSSIYLTNPLTQTAQLSEISSYVSNTSGNWVVLSNPVNTSVISASLTNYTIQPTVQILGDGSSPCLAYSSVSNGQISGVTIIDRGAGYTHAQAIIVANSAFGAGANLNIVVPPNGGHGSDPASELNMKGMAIYFQFSNTYASSLPTYGQYSSYGIVKNPLMASNTNYVYFSNTFNQLFRSNPATNKVFALNEMVIGQTSNAIGYVYQSNTIDLYLTGDKNFVNNEVVIGQTSGQSDRIIINSRGDIYPQNLDVLYVRDIPHVSRTNTQTESFKLIIEL